MPKIKTTLWIIGGIIGVFILFGIIAGITSEAPKEEVETEKPKEIIGEASQPVKELVEELVQEEQPKEEVKKEPSTAPESEPKPEVAPTPVPVPTTEEKSIPEPKPEPEEERPPIEEKEELFIDIISVTSPISKGSNAILKAKTLTGASCTITVYYKSGASKAKGLYPKTADSGGNVSWTWKVGTRTTSGSWKIVVTASLGEKTQSATTYFTVQ